MLKASQLDNDIKKALAVIFYANKVDEDSKADINSEVDVDSEINVDNKVEKNEDIVDVRDYINQSLY